jgi:hypothetical protein
MAGRRGKIQINWWFIDVVLLSFAASLAVTHLYIPRANVTWDEANYLVWAYRIAQALRAGDFGRLLTLTREQFIWLPLHSWVIGIPLAFVGYTVIKARIVGLYLFILTSIGVFFLGKKTDKKRGNWVGLAASLLFLTSPMMLFFAGLAMKEMLGAAVSVGIILIYIHAREKQTWYWDVSVALGLILGILAKYNYGFVVAGGITLEVIWVLLTEKKKVTVLTHHLLMGLPLALFLLWWVLTPENKFPLFMSILANTHSYTTEFARTNYNGLLFYPRAILYMYSASVWIGYGLLASFFLVIPFLKNRVLRLSWIIFGLNALLGTTHTDGMVERYILTTAPFLFIIGAYIAVTVVSWVYAQYRNRPVAAVLLGVFTAAVVFIFVDIVQLPQYVYSVATYVTKDVLFNQQDYRDLWFDYDRTKWSHNLPQSPFEKPQDIIDYILTTANPYKPIQVIGYSGEFSPWYFELLTNLAEEKGAPKADGYREYLAIINIHPTSRFHTRTLWWYNSRHPKNIVPSSVDPSYAPVGYKNFPGLDIDVTVYGRR